MEIKAVLNRYRKSAQKAREVIGRLKGLEVADALAQLQNSKKGCSRDLIKLINSAMANAKNNFNIQEENLFIKDFRADEKMTMKRWRARAYGRAARILKRTCSVTLILDEKEGAKKKKQAEVKNRVKAIQAEEETGSKEEKNKEEIKEEKREIKDQKKLKDVKDIKEKKDIKGGQSKIFRRKSF